MKGGEHLRGAAAASSGMGAVSSCLWTVAAAGKHIVADKTLYGCTFAFLNHGMTRYGVEVDFIDTSNLDEVRAYQEEAKRMAIAKKNMFIPFVSIISQGINYVNIFVSKYT